MTASTARPIDGLADITAIQQVASRLWPQGWHPGGLGWALARGQLAEEVAIIDGPTGPAGWAARGMDEPGYLLALADPAIPSAAEAIATWFWDTATLPELTIELAHGDSAVLAALRRVGFEVRRTGTVVGMRRVVASPPAAPSAGYSVRPVRLGETEARVDVHRAAWRPASLPYAAEHRRAVDPNATSSFTVAAYDAVRRTWLYDRALDLVAVAPDGSLAGCCIAWQDPATRVAEIEPLGVVPEHRGRGVAVALCLEVVARVAAAGGREIFINTGPRPEYPAPGRAYSRAGFETFDRADTYQLTRETRGTGAAVSGQDDEQTLPPAAWPGIPGPMSPPEGEALAGGNMGKVVRIGGTVRRSAGPWTPAVHSLLQYLNETGFSAAPAALGMDAAGREVLTYIPGDTVMTPVADEVWFTTMADAAALLRHYHDLTLNFESPPGAVWRDHPADPGPAEVICHSDWAPYNAIWRAGRLVGMIDWDFARPGSRLYDLAWFALMWCPLAPPERFHADLPAPVDQPRRLRELCDAYCLEHREGLLDAIYRRVEATPRWIESGAAAGDPVHVKMLAEGHADHSRHVIAHLERTWEALADALA